MLNFLLCFIALVIVLCVILNNASQKIGMPMLLAFIVLGIVLGNFGPHPVKFEDYSFAENFSTVALIFIMFYGGFGTRWKTGSATSAWTPSGSVTRSGPGWTRRRPGSAPRKPRRPSPACGPPVPPICNARRGTSFWPPGQHTPGGRPQHKEVL